MALSETEQQILAQIEHFEYELPELKEDAQEALKWGLASSLLGAGVIKFAFMVDEATDNRIGAIPETFGICSGGSSMFLGAIGLYAAVKNGISYLKQRT